MFIDSDIFEKRERYIHGPNEAIRNDRSGEQQVSSSGFIDRPIMVAALRWPLPDHPRAGAA